MGSFGHRPQAAIAGVATEADAERAGSVLKTAFRDRRTTLFAVATLTGVLAVLLMLGWQVYQFASDGTAAGEAETRIDDNAKLRNPGPAAPSSKVRDDRLPDDAKLVIPTVADRDATDSASQTAADSSPRTTQLTDDPFAAATNDRSPPGGAKAVPQPRVELDGPLEIGAAKVDPPATGRPAGTNRSPFDEPQFGDRKSSSLSKKESPSAAMPFAKSPESTVVDAGAPLGLEVVRTSVAPPPPPDPRFLVTSAGTTANSASGAPRVRITEDPASPTDGWSATRDDRGHPTIVRTRHGRTSPAAVAVTSTANARWSVSAPKLKLEIRLPPRIVVGQRAPVRLRIVNAGTATAAGVTLHVDLPAGLAYPLGRRLSHDVGDLRPGAFHEARLTPVAAQTGDATVSATVFCKQDRASGKQTRTIAAAP